MSETTVGSGLLVAEENNAGVTVFVAENYTASPLLLSRLSTLVLPLIIA